MSYDASAPKAIFRGDGEELLDHLLLACHGHKLNKPLEGFGRELVPYFGADEEVPSPGPARKFASCGSPPPSESSSRRKSARKSNNNNSNNKQNAAAAASAGASPRGASPVRSVGADAACPAFFSSPKPEAIPLPSFGFLNKARPSFPGALVTPIAAA